MYELWVVICIAVLAMAAGFIAAKGISYTRTYWTELRQAKEEKLLDLYQERALYASIVTSVLVTLFGLEGEELTESNYFTSEHLDKDGFITYVTLVNLVTEETLSLVINLKRNKMNIQYEVPLNDEDRLKWRKVFKIDNVDNYMGAATLDWIAKCRNTLVGEDK